MPIKKTSVKRDGLQQYRVRINYTDADGIYRQAERTAYGKEEAKALENALIAELAKKPHAQKKDMTVSELVAVYQQHHAPDVRESSLEQYSKSIKSYVIPVLGDTSIFGLTPKKLSDWRAELSKKDLSVKTLQNAFAALRATLNYAVAQKILPENPIVAIKNFRDPYEKAKDTTLHYYTAEQFIEYITVAKASAKDMRHWGLYVFFNVAYYTGMRKGEINALKWTDIKNNFIIVRRSVSQKLKSQKITETPPKNKSSNRDIEIPTPLKNVLEEHKKRQQADSRWTPDYRICGGIDCLADTTIDHFNRQTAKAAGLERIRVHDFRHSHASLLANEGINIQEVARRLGHSDIKMTWNTYSHLYPREESRAVQVLNRIVAPSDMPAAQKIPEKSPNKKNAENRQVAKTSEMA